MTGVLDDLGVQRGSATFLAGPYAVTCSDPQQAFPTAAFTPCSALVLPLGDTVVTDT